MACVATFCGTQAIFSKTMTAEQQTSHTLLERDETIILAGRKYRIAPPTIATLVMVSEDVSSLPSLSIEGDILRQVLDNAKDCQAIARIVATIILGAKTIRRFTGKIRFKLLTQRIAESCSPQEINVALATLLMQMQIGDFFACTTSLKGVNLTKATREVETQSGE